MLWDRQKSESHQAFHGFAHYRDMGPERSRDKAFREHLVRCLGRKETIRQAPGRWTRWSVQWQWSARANAYDDDLDRRQRQEREKEILEARSKHANLARLVQVKFLERLRDLDPKDIPVAALPRWLEIAVRVELNALGLPTTDVKVRHEEIASIVREEDFEIERRLLEDPEAAHLASQLFARLTVVGEDDSGPWH